MKNLNTYDIEVWEKVLKDLPAPYKKWFNEEKKYLRKNITKDSKILEVGCGEGRSLKDIIDITKNLTGIEHDPQAVNKTKIRFRNYPNIKIIRADAVKLPFDNKSFDFVICMTTLANFGKNKFKVFDEMKRVLKDGGRIIISVFSENAFNERMKLYKKLKFPIKKIIGTTVMFDDKYGEGISEQFSEKQLKEIFAKAKLKVIEIKKLNIAYICKLKK